MTGQGLEGVTQGNEPVPDSGTLNGIGQYTTPSQYTNYTLLPNSTYRLRLVNSGSFAAIRFSVDGHTLSVVEADGTPVVPFSVSGVVLDVAQRYSVLLRTNGTGGAFWMRSTILQDSFTVRFFGLGILLRNFCSCLNIQYTEPGFNDNILGAIRYGVDDTNLMPNTSLAANDPGAGGLPDLAVAQLIPADAINPPNSTM